jgi:hypothetical protein
MSRKVQLALLGVLIAPQGALAAPFCMSLLGMEPQCMYYDAAQCRTDSGKQGGSCVPNPAEPRTRSVAGSGKYCLVTSAGATMCSYLDYDSCDVAAGHQRGACYFDALGSSGVPDPYAASNQPQQ